MSSQSSPPALHVAAQPPSSPPAEILRLSGVSKSFPGVRALESIDVALDAGEILGVVGENGAGKSTLLKIFGGILQPDEGDIWIDSSRRTLRGVRDAMSAGISLIHQELNLAPDLSIAENLYLGRQPSRGPRWLPVTDRRTMRRDAQRELARVGLAVDAGERLGRLEIARRQLVEIAKALATRARILIFDEPTSSLSLVEADRLLAIIAELRRNGTSIIYVSHRLAEVERIADRVVVLRDGRQVGALSGDEISHQRMISLMVGRDLQPSVRSSRVRHDGTPALRVRELRLSAASPALNFCIYPGEIVGFAGIVGAGRTEVAQALMGITRPVSGAIEIGGRPTQIKNAVHAIRAGLALVPEDRKSLGILADLPIDVNLSMCKLPQLGRGGWYNRRGERRLAERLRQELNIRAPRLDADASTLSGGNQQKVVLGKWLAVAPNVLICDEPTRGVDVAGKREIYRLIRQAAERGAGVMLISSEMEEIIALADRVLVMRCGAIAGEVSGADVGEVAIMRLAVGVAGEASRT